MRQTFPENRAGTQGKKKPSSDRSLPTSNRVITSGINFTRLRVRAGGQAYLISIEILIYKDSAFHRSEIRRAVRFEFAIVVYEQWRELRGSTLPYGRKKTF